MQIDKDQILDLLRGQGRPEVADQAAGELPDTVDTDRDAGLLARFGLTPETLISLLAGAAGGGGALGAVSGLLGGGDKGGDEDRDGKEGGLGGALGGLLGR